MFKVESLKWKVACNLDGIRSKRSRAAQQGCAAWVAESGCCQSGMFKVESLKWKVACNLDDIRSKHKLSVFNLITRSLKLPSTGALEAFMLDIATIGIFPSFNRKFPFLWCNSNCIFVAS